MSKLPTSTAFIRAVEALAARAPTYRTGGTGADGTCDCIGATMGAMYALGHAKYSMHSSNYFARHQMETLQPLTTPQDCYPGMQVYKARDGEGHLNARYLPGGRYHNGDPLDYYHAGVVTRVNPLEILHCTSGGGANGFVRDSRLGKWSHGGRLKGVDYAEEAEALPDGNNLPEGDGFPSGDAFSKGDGFPEGSAFPNGNETTINLLPNEEIIPNGNPCACTCGNCCCHGRGSSPGSGGSTGNAPGSINPTGNSPGNLNGSINPNASYSPGNAPGSINPSASNSPATPTGSTSPLPAYVYAPTGGTVNLRARPSRSAARLCRVPIGERVQVLERGSDWCRVRHESRTGWMMSRFLCSSLPPEAAP